MANWLITGASSGLGGALRPPSWRAAERSAFEALAPG